MENIVASFPKILRQLEDNPEAREAFVFAAWRRSVGESLNEHAVPVAFSDSRLKVAVSNETWRRHLVDMAGEILFKLNSNLVSSSVTFLEFFADQDAVTENLQAHPLGAAKAAKESAVEEEITNELRDAAAAIDDEGLKTAFLLAAGSCLARSKRNMNKG